MPDRATPGLGEDWFNGWLAAVGATVIVDGLRLRWSEGRRAHAIFSCEGDRDIAGLIADNLPSINHLRSLITANDDKQFPQEITSACYAAAAERNRHRQSDFSLACCATDLVDIRRGADRGRFNTAAPKGLTLWDRLKGCVEQLEADAQKRQVTLSSYVAASLDGTLRRVKTNGLGFDVRRIEAGDPPNAGKFVDPVVEILAFHGLALFPVRGDGHREATRGWGRRETEPSRSPGSASARRKWVDSFSWPSWRASLDRWAIDALLAEMYRPAGRARGRRLDALGVRRVYEAVPFQKVGDMDMTAGYASRRQHE